jgi:hypothetical protein
VRRLAYQVNILCRPGLLAQPTQQSAGSGNCVGALEPFGGNGLRGQITAVHNREHRRFVVDKQHSRTAPSLAARKTAHQRRCCLRLGQHHDVLNAGVVQRLPQLIGSELIRPAQPGGHQPVILVCQRPICTDHRLGQSRDRILREVDDRLVDYAMATGTRFDEGQAGDRTGDCDA